MFKYILEIEGMKCSMCEAHINDVVRKTVNCKKLKSSHKKNLTTFMSEDLIDEDYLKDAIENTGYKVLSIKCE